MISKHQGREQKLSMVYLEDLVPKDHYLRKIDKFMDFSFVYEYVEDMYSTTGRPSIDPVVLMKYALLMHLENRNTMRGTFREAEVNIAHRWFLGYGLDEKLPHFSDFSKTYTRKFSKEIEIKDKAGNIICKKTIFAILFEKVLEKAEEGHFLYLRHIYEDSTHIKANANKRKVEKIEIEEERKKYQDQLDKEIDEYCKEHDLNQPKPVKLEKKTKKVSTTDPDSGVFNKGEHEVQVAYLAQTICDDNGIILSTKVNPANLHDSTTFEEPYNEVIGKYGVGDGKICSIGLDAGFKVPVVIKTVLESGVTPLLPYTCPKGKKYNEENPAKIGKRDFEYDEQKDVFYCPNGCVLTPRGVNRKSGDITYRSKTKDCNDCPFRNNCLSKSQTSKTVLRNIWAKYIDEAEKIRYSEYHATHYKRRKETIERVFADAKEKFGARFTRLKGIKKVQDEMCLVFTCMNLKKISNWAWKMA